MRPLRRTESALPGFTVSVFDIDGLPGDIVEGTEGFIDQSKGLATYLLGYDPGFADVAERIRAANLKWT